MANKERSNQTSSVLERKEALERKIEVMLKDWQRERDAMLTRQLALNSEVRQRCYEINLTERQLMVG